MRRYALALLAALVLAFGAYFLNRRDTDPPPLPQNRHPLDLRDLRFHWQNRRAEGHAATNVHSHSARAWPGFDGKSCEGPDNPEADGGFIGRRERNLLSAHERV